ncbi:MAG: hypothetical protein P8M03_07525 [Flavobacteriaceae bacterium]|nr:hypothetical protein [Flavobacteriaceae bacterium]
MKISKSRSDETIYLAIYIGAIGTVAAALIYILKNYFNVPLSELGPLQLIMVLSFIAWPTALVKQFFNPFK